MGYEPCGKRRVRNIMNCPTSSSKWKLKLRRTSWFKKSIICAQDSQTVEQNDEFKRYGVLADDVFEPSLWYFNDLLFPVGQGTLVQNRSTLQEVNEAMTKKCKVY
jgi:hypothetical protein